jgi:phasin family protein
MLQCSIDIAPPFVAAPEGVRNMTAKTKTGAERATKNGADAMQAGFEKAAQGYGQFVAFGKDITEAWLKSAGIAGKGIETIHSEFHAYSRDAIEGGVTATKAVLASKNVQEAIEIHSDFAKSAFETYVQQMTKLTDIAMNVAKEASEPLQEHTSAFVEMVQNKRAA